MIRLAPSPRDMPSIGADAALRSPRSTSAGALSPTAARRRMMHAAGRAGGRAAGGGPSPRGGSAFWSESHPEFLAAEVSTASDPPGRKDSPPNADGVGARPPVRSPSSAPASPPAAFDDCSSAASSSILTSVCTPKIVMSIEGASLGGAATARRQARQPSNSRGSQRLATVADNSNSGSGSTSTTPTRDEDDGENHDGNGVRSGGSTPATSPTAAAAAKKAKSKKMVVVDPRSGKKYQLKADDSSPPCLTDKELHVYHKKKGRKAVGASGSTGGRGDGNTDPGNTAASETETPPFEAVQGAADRQRHHRRTLSVQSDTFTVETMDTNDGTECTGASESFQTLETASALTDVSYYGRGRNFCAVPTSCRSIEELALGDIRRNGGRDLFDDDELRDVAPGARAGGLRVDTAASVGEDGSSDGGDGRGSPLGAILDTAAALLSPIGAAAAHPPRA